MGALSSCFGRGNSSDDNDTDESRRLLHTPYVAGYGSTNAASSDAPDSEAMRREREALEGIYHSLSDNVFDVFSAQAQNQMNQHQMSKTNRIGQTAEARELQDESVGYPEYGLGRGNGNGDGNGELPASEEMRLRTIKRGRSGPMFISMQKANGGMGAVQDAMG